MSYLAEVGIRVTLVPEDMEELLKSYYREKERTTDMIYLATNFHVIVDPSITYSTDPTPDHQIWNNTYSDDEDLWFRAVNMRQTHPEDIYDYVSKWISFQERYNRCCRRSRCTATSTSTSLRTSFRITTSRPT